MKSQAVFVLSLIGLSSAVALPSSAPATTLAGSCAGLFCIAEQRPVFHAELNACKCEWIPGLEPGGPPIISRSSETCDDVICIAEQHPVFHPELNACTCDWIPGLEPGPPVDARSTPPPETCPTVRCMGGFTPVYHPETGKCTCEPASK
ncbi:hypothetical protein MMC07_007708 [Pseudocyphellaria aurata]|nr:hypothetical protein [Pseudocyphellaria aurata]